MRAEHQVHFSSEEDEPATKIVIKTSFSEDGESSSASDSDLDVHKQRQAVCSNLDPSLVMDTSTPTPINPKLQCRMYESEYPEVNDLVMVTVQQIAEMGAYVSLGEYNNIEGMVLLSELSRRRIRSVHRLIRVGKNEVVVVLRVDREKGYIDLSKRRVSPEDVVKFEEKYNKSKVVHSIMRHVAEKLDIELERLYKMIGWPLYKSHGHAFDAFKASLTDPRKLWDSLPGQVAEEVKRELMANITRRLTPQKLKIRADIEVACFAYEGIEAVKKALKQAESCSTQEIPLKVKLVAPPLYVISTTCMDRAKGMSLMDQSIDRITQSITSSGGQIVIKMKPKVVSDVEDKELDALMRKSELENAEVSGDEAVSD